MDTTLILGAGASADFGMPLGGGLYERALETLKALRSDWNKRWESDPFFDFRRMVSFMTGEPSREKLLQFALREEPDGRQIFNIDPIFDLIEIMEKAPAYSLDTLALEYPEKTEILAVLTAKEIIDVIKSQISHDREAVERRIWDNRRFQSVGNAQSVTLNWIHLFCSMVRSSLGKNSEQSYDVVSFNYDRLFENVAKTVWSNPTRELGAFDDIFNIIYPHGKIEWTIDTIGRSNLSVEDSRITFAHNKPDEFDASETKEALQRADRLIFLGFHFSPENIETLGLNDVKREVEITYQNYDNNSGLDRRVNEFGFINLRKFSGDISNAILQGDLGDLPS